MLIRYLEQAQLCPIDERRVADALADLQALLHAAPPGRVVGHEEAAPAEVEEGLREVALAPQRPPDVDAFVEHRPAGRQIALVAGKGAGRSRAPEPGPRRAPTARPAPPAEA